VQILTKVANFDALMKKIKTYSSKKTVYNALCQHFIKARAPNPGLEPFLSPSKIVKRLKPSSPEPRMRSTTSPIPHFAGSWLPATERERERSTECTSQKEENANEAISLIRVIEVFEA
jgi:hypothetical protein